MQGLAKQRYLVIIMIKKQEIAKNFYGVVAKV
jgi:hypothetical protein